MVYIQATGEQSAEMVTDEGAIYVTSNRGYNWKAAVQETVSATLNRTVSSGISGAIYYTDTSNTVNRSPDGSYVAVSSRGNFFLTWERLLAKLEEEREAQKRYWEEHSRDLTFEATMLDSRAADLDKEERPKEDEATEIELQLEARLEEQSSSSPSTRPSPPTPPTWTSSSASKETWQAMDE
ncbi:hypothetical protein ZWY2020_050160 [Hordeum vulgare]|nr:hypothetical protein ZWY2020_050160 [Hordeum vulgare]